MQSSSSFSDSRTGKARPSNLMPIRTEQADNLPWPSPSFTVSSSEDGTISADPGRPSSQIKSSPTGRLPPTPLTATYKPTILPVDTKASTLKLPGVDALLAHTPPGDDDEDINRKVPPSPLPIAHDYHSNIVEDTPIRTGYSPTEAEAPARMPTSASKTGLFQGSSSEWAGNHASFALMDRRQYAPRPNLERHNIAPVSPQRFRNMPSSKQVQGLGLDLGEETPRLGSAESMMRTPTLATFQRLPGLPGAPNLSGSEGGRFPTLTPSSPIKLPLRQWSTDLYFEHRQYVPRPFVHRSYTEGPSSVAMEREKVVEIDGGLPMGSRAWGLALSTDDGISFRRGDVLHRQDGSVIGPALVPRQSQITQITAPPTPSARSAYASTSASRTVTASPSVHSSASKRHLNSTGLTPHIHKTRLTPTAGSTSRAKANKDAAGDEVPSPSLKMQSKIRSDQLREQAEFIASQGHLPSDVPTLTTSSSSPVSPARSSDEYALEAHSRTAPPSVSPRNKRALSTRNIDQNTQRMDSSPWGVFGINTAHDAWQPLGPPVLSKVLAKIDISDNKISQLEEQDNAKKARRTNSSSSDSVSSATFGKKKQSSMFSRLSNRSSSSSSNGEDKENDVFGSSTTVNRRRSVVASPPMVPIKATTTARRIVNIR
jgi:hypothetical protein